MDPTYNISNNLTGLNPPLGVPWPSRGIGQGQSDLCQVVTPVISHLGTGKLVGDPQY